MPFFYTNLLIFIVDCSVFLQNSLVHDAKKCIIAAKTIKKRTGTNIKNYAIRDFPNMNWMFMRRTWKMINRWHNKTKISWPVYHQKHGRKIQSVSSCDRCFCAVSSWRSLFFYLLYHRSITNLCDEIEDDNGDDEDESLTQNDFNEAAGVSQVDHYYDRFLDRIRRGTHF